MQLEAFFFSESAMLWMWKEQEGAFARCLKTFLKLPLSLLSASVVTVADMAGAVEGIHWRENGNGLCTYLGHV